MNVRDVQPPESTPGAKPGTRTGRRPPLLVPVSRNVVPPLSFAQQRLWFIEQLAPGGYAYNVPLAARLSGPLDVAVLERSLVELVRRHEALRTTFVLVEGRPSQRIAPEPVVSLPVESLEALPEAERSPTARRRAEEEARRPFDLEQGPLVRAKLLRLSASAHVLLLTLHHAVCDGWSLEVMERELSELYRALLAGEAPVLPALRVQCVDHAVWQREWLARDVLEGQLAWWKQRLAGAPPVLELPTDRPRPPVQSLQGAVLAVPLPPGLSEAVRTWSRQEGVTPFMTLLAAFQVLLSRYSGQRDIVVGSLLSGRNRRELEGLIGFFANTLPLRVEVPGERGFRELLRRVRTCCLEAHAHQDVPFEQLVDALQPARDLSRPPLFQASFTLQNAAPFSALTLPGVAVEALGFEPGVAKFDLTLFMRETPEGLVGLWEYSTALFDEATVARMAAHYARLLEGALANPERALAELPLLSDAERHQVLVEWNPARTESPRPATVHGLFEDHAARRPEAEAVEYEGERLTYAALNRRANQVARYLRRLGVGEGSRVGLCAERTLELMAAMLGILKAGGAYVPLDPSYPAERLTFMVEDTAVPVVLAQPELMSKLPPMSATVVPLERSWETFAHEDEENLGETGGPEAMAYVMYTSGSTGRPKGVCIPHRGIVRLARDTVHVRLTREDRVAQVCNTSFDASTLEVWGALLNGGCLVGVPREVALSPRGLTTFLRETRISVTVLPTALFHQVAAECPDAFHTLTYVVAGGEAPEPKAMRTVLERGAPRHLVNGYGPTENTTASTFFVVERVPEGAVSVPMGTPPANAEVYVLDERIQPVPVGVAGELYVGGEGLALGYLNRPELTAERFVAHPFSPRPGARLYRTGDLARYLPDGNLEFLGRRDEQVKVRGFRVELGEIETALAKHAGVGEAVVVARDDGASGKRLVAYGVPTSPRPPGEGRGEGATGPGLNPEELRTWLKQTLPVHMVPSAFVWLEALPLTPNGKVDRKALPEPEPEGVSTEYVAPRTALEQLVAEVWASLLGVRRVGAHDHFFELGGHSLLATRAVSRLREVLRVELPVRALFESPTVAELARRLESAAEPHQGPRPPPLVSQPEEGALPLSFAQQGLWLFEQLAPGGFTYNVPYVTRLRGRLEVPALERSLEELIRRHEALRTTFTQVEGQPAQRVAPALAFTLPVEDLEGELQRRVEEEFRRPFDLERGPLFRALLLRVAAEEHVLVLVLHHIVCDGWSLGVLAREMAELYQAFSTGSAPSLPELPVRYGDYSRWQRKWLKGEALESPLGWWKQQLAGVPPVLELPTDRPRPPVQTFRGAMIPMRLPVSLSRALRELSRQEGVTPFMTLLAGFQALLARYSGQKDFVVGSPGAGRTWGELEGLVGLFVNTLALRARVSGTESFRTLLGRVREACLGAYAHQELPVEQLLHTLQPMRDPSRAQLFQVVFSQIEPAPVLPLPGVVSEEVAFETGLAKFDLNLFVRETEEGWESLWEYNTGLYDEATVARMAAHYVRLLEGAVARPEQEVSALPLLADEERRRLLVEWNQTRTEYPRHASVHSLFEEQAARRPEAVAVEYEGQRLTYGELNVRANQVARTLRGLGVGAGTLVGLCAGRSVELVVATLGILKAGGAYVPLDPSYPPERLAFMLEDTAVTVVLAQPELASELPAGGAFILELSPETFAHESGENLEETVGPESLAYVMYTSGSTGRPKGVCIPHRGIVRLVRDTHFVRFTEEDRVAQLSNTSFDASTLELWGALLNGGGLIGVPREVALAPKALATFLREQRVSAMFLTTSLFNQVAAECPEAFLTVRQVLFGGEAADPRWVRAVLETGRTGTLVNGYGPTEVTTFTCCYVMTEPGQVGNPMPIGRPISNTVVYVLDERMQPVPVGVVGELYAGGDGLGLGYLNRPDLTAERFVPHPFSEDPRARLYKTGDRVRYLADGRLEYLGRRDAQVKVRGFRIELGEVEAALAKYPGVGEVAVVVRDDGPSGKHLVAYVVPTSPRPPGEGRGEGATGPGFKPEELRTWLEQTLPEYMVPSAFVRLERLPLTPNGKLDRDALPAPEAEGAEREEYVAPRTRMEQLVADIWAPLLKQPRVGARDDFFELGGHSLLAAQVATRLREALQRDFPILMLFEAPTVEALAARLEALPGATEESGVPPLVPVSREGELPLSFAQQRLWFIEQLEPGGFTYNVPYALRLRGRLDVSALERSLGEIIRRHETLRTTFLLVDGRPVQHVAPELALTLAVDDLEGQEAGEATLRVEQEARRPFDLVTGPLVRAKLLRVAAEEHVLVLVVHHIACDLWSLNVLSRELETLYAAYGSGTEPMLPALPVQYADYAAWQREWLKSERLEEQLAWWKQRLAGAPPVLELPADRPRTPVQTFRGAHLTVPLPAGLAGAVKALSNEEGVTPFMAFLTGFEALLARYSGQTDLVVGTPISGRNRREVEGLIGFFLNTLALRVEASGDVSFRELLGRVRESCLGAYAHQDVPFEQLVDALQPVRDLSRSPLFQVMFVYQTGLTAMALPGVSVDELSFQPGMAKFDLTLFVRETAEGLVSLWEYNTGLYDEATVARMAAHYTRLMEGAVAEPERKVSALPLMDEAERRRVLVEFNDTRVLYAPANGVHELFEAWADRTPESVAVSFGEERLTYGELNRKANRLAHHLRSLGVGPDVPVGLCVGRSMDLAVGVLGILKAGGAYVPLDPAYPAERLALMLGASRAPVLLTQRRLADTLPASEAKRLYLDEEAALWAGRAESNPEQVSGPEALAYVIYTSGSTGVPKGVAMHHRPLLNLIRWQVARSAEKPRTLQFSALSFDVSFQELFSTWGAGGELVLIPEELRLEARALLEKLDSGGVQRLFLPFVALQNLAEEADREGLAPRALKEVITAGEQLRVTPALRRLMKRLGGVLENQYGPTETHVATAYRLEGDPETWPEVPSIGGPIANTSVHLLDAWGEPVPVGVVGELYIGGAAVARGYLHRPELTEERFIPDGYKAKPGGRLYRTGDYARYLEDGNLEFLGRRDAQVKVRGFRIELAEVESALSKHPAVKDVVVVAREGGAGARKLVAYVITSPLPPGEGRGEGIENPGLNAESLRTWLKNRLPEYMVPSVFMCLESFPLTPSGKVDRRALPEPEAEGTGQEKYEAPRTDLEQAVAEIWVQLLGVRRVGAHDNFFDLGGHSLLAMRVTSRLREALKVDLPVRVLFEAPTVAELASRLEVLSEINPEPRLPPLVSVPRQGALPLSFAQQRLWFLDRIHPSSALYNIALVLRLEGVLDVAALERSFQALVQRHEALRTTFPQGEQGGVQVVSEAMELPLAVVELRELPEGAREEEARRLASGEVERPFDLKTGPLLRVTLLRTGEAEHVLVMAMHHIVSDGWSMGVLTRELKALYEAFVEGRAPVLEALPIQYADYATWQQAWLRGEVLESTLAWWCEQLRGASPALELPTDRPRPALQSYRGAVHYVQLPWELAEGLRKLSQKEGVTLFMTLLAGFQALLHRYSGQDDISVGSPIAGRDHAQLEGLIGFFVNVLVMRAKVRGEASFRELLHQVREVALGAYAHQEVPFEKLVEALNPVRDTRRAPLFQVSFSLQNTPSPDLALPGIESRPVELTGQVSKYDLTLSLRETQAGLEGVVEYSTDLFDASTIVRMLGHLRTLLEGVVADPGRRVDGLPLLDELERRLLLVEWNQTRTEYPRHASVHALFEEQVARRPEALAVDYEGQRLTYGELNARANQVARALRRLGVGAGTLVGLCARRSPELVAAMLGVLKAGGAYVPLDPSYPPERLAFMLEDSAVPVVLAQPELASELPAGSAFVLELTWEEFAHESGENLEEAVGPESLAYVMYTSGSTGRPKGVCIPHRGVVRLVRDTGAVLVTAEDRFTQMANTSFDSSNLELWGALLNGASLVGVPREVALSPKALAAFVREQRVSAVVFTTPFFNQVVAECPDAFQTVRYVMFGGEAADPVRLREVLRRGGNPKLLNLYGPTENTTNTTWYEVKEVPEGAVSVPIGGPVANTDVYVLDERMQPVPVGVPGELYTGGDGLARGYLNRPELTAEKFVAHPFSTEPGAKLYRTGDLVKYLPDGRLEFLGRRDGQVKVRGFRIELGEIEAALARHPGVSAGVVMARDDGPSGRWLVAYVVPISPRPPGEGRGEGISGPELKPEELRLWLKQSLPEHMVPAVIVLLETLPLTPNGKVDRKALPAPDSQRAGFGASYVAPESGLEQSLAAIWAEVLQVDRVGADDNFFDVGGNSLLLQAVHMKVEALVGRTLPMVELFQFSTVRTLATRLAEKLGDGREPAAPERTSCLVRLQGGSPWPALFFPHAMGGRTLFYRELARRIAPHRPAYGFDAPGLEAGGLEPTTIEEMAAHYLELLRAVQPTGPYLLIGASFGGVIAYEMGRRLSAEGHAVPLCALLDSPGPEHFPPPPEDDAALLAGMVASWVDLPAGALRGLPAEAQLQKVLDEAARRGIEPPFPDVERGLRFLRVWRSHAEALHRYTAPRWEGGALRFFRAAELQPGRPAQLELGWADRCSEVRVEVVPGDHDSMLLPPHVDVLAARLQECLERALVE